MRSLDGERGGQNRDKQLQAVASSALLLVPGMIHSVAILVGAASWAVVGHGDSWTTAKRRDQRLSFCARQRSSRRSSHTTETRILMNVRESYVQSTAG